MKKNNWRRDDIAIFAFAAILLTSIFAVDAIKRHNERCCYENNERWSKACWARWKIAHWDRPNFDDQ